MTIRSSVLAFIVVAVSAGASSASQATSGPAEAARGLSIEYADGRVTTRVLRPSGNMWTPRFPLLPNADNGIEVPSALDVAHVVEGADVIITVALRYGTPHERRVSVAKVRVTPDAPVRVDDLKAFGVAPVTVAIVPVPVTLTHPPLVVSASGSLDIRVDPIAPDVPAYRLIIANDSPHALMAVHFEAFDGERRLLSGRKRGDRNQPLAPPKGTYVLELPLSHGSQVGATSSDEWKVLDRVVVTSVLWADGVVEGDPAPAAQEHAIYAGRAKQLERVLAALSRARTGTPAALRSEIAALSVDSGGGMQQVKDALLRDLDAFETAAAGGSRGFDHWITTTILEYERWKARITGPVR